jgi:hypothetical protein
MGAILDKLERTKASIRAKVEHPFRVIKRQFGYVKVKYRGLAKNTANLMTLFALSNIWMVRKRLLNMGCAGMSAPENGQRAGNGGKTASKPPLQRQKCRHLKSQPTTTCFSGCCADLP